jgi:hypothetical protein
MTGAWEEDSGPEHTGIARPGAIPLAHDKTRPPRPPPPRFSRRQRFWRRVFRWLTKGAGLGEEYLEAKVGQERAQAQKLFEEAGEANARAEHQRSQTEAATQDVVKKFIENLVAIRKLPDEASRMIAFAKVMEQNPGVCDKLQELQAVLEKLQLPAH